MHVFCDPTLQFKANNTEAVQEVVRGGQMMDYSDTSQEHSSLSSTLPLLDRGLSVFHCH